MKYPYTLVQSAAPSATPVSLAEAKEHLRVTDSNSDAYITALIQTAVDHLDGWHGILGRCMITQTWTLNYDFWENDLGLPFPFQSITSVKYYDTLDVLQTVDSSNYELVKSLNHPFIRFKSTYQLPSLYEYRTDRLEVIGIAGYGAAEAVPLTLKHCIKLLVANWYENREPVRSSGMPLPLGFGDLVEPYRLKGRF